MAGLGYGSRACSTGLRSGGASRARQSHRKKLPRSTADPEVSPREIDPFKGGCARTLLSKLAAICARLPETEPGTQFGAPVWNAGKKTFVSTHYYTGRLHLSFWVGAERQATLTKDDRFRISPYTGHIGWIDLDVEERQDWEEIKQLALASYRHFALKRMLTALDEV